MKFLFMDWMATFRCVGGECPMTCCGNWNIGLLDEDIQGYKKLAEQHSFGKEIWKAVDEERHCMRQCDGRCQMLTEDGWCRIVLECGEEYLSGTCTTFPRKVKQFGDIMECMVEIVCPLVAERVFDDKKIEFMVGDIEPEADDTIDDALDMELYDTLSLGRTFLIELFQKYDFTYSAAKLYIMFQAIRAVQEMYGNHQLHRDTMERWLQRWDDGNCAAVYESLVSITGRTELKAVKLLEFLDKLIAIDAMEYLVCDVKDNTLEEDFQRWIRDRKGFEEEIKGYTKYFTEHYPLAFENFFIFMLFREWIPVKLEMGKFGESFMIRVVVWCLIQLCAMSVWNRKGEVTPKEYAMIVAGFDRISAHSTVIFDELVRVLKEEDNIAILLLYLIC